MWTFIVRVTGIMSMVSEGEGIQHACGQFEHAIDSVNLARVKRKEKKRGKHGKHGFRSFWCSNKQRFTEDAERRVVATRERSPPPTSYKEGVSRASRSTLALWMSLIPTL
jgi:hypothetical protein